MPESTAALVASVLKDIEALPRWKRCDWCGWPLNADRKDGCTWDSCSQRPLPVHEDTAMLQLIRRAHAALRALPAAATYERMCSDAWRAKLRKNVAASVDLCGEDDEDTAILWALNDLASCERALQATAAELAEVKRERDALKAALEMARTALQTYDYDPANGNTSEGGLIDEGRYHHERMMQSIDAALSRARAT